MLSFKDYGNGRPIAIIKSGKLDGQIIFVNPDSIKGLNNIMIKDKGYLVPFLNPKQRGVVYVAGKSGSGKSTYAAQIIYNYLEIFPNNKVFIFSRLEIDPVLDALGCIPIPINDELDQVDAIKDIANALCLFDDIDTIRDKNLRSKVYAIQNDILEAGRKKNINIIVTSHLINGNDRNNCRTILNEASEITFFPRSGSAHGIRYLLEKYIELSKPQIAEIMKLPSRWVTVGTSYPGYIFHEKGAFML